MRIALLLILMLGTIALAEPPELPLPTSHAPISRLARTCTGVLVATLVRAGHAKPGAPGYTDYDLSRWQINADLRGSYPAEDRLDYRVQTYPEQFRERAPVVGHRYIVLTDENSVHGVAYIFDYSDEKLQEVQHLMAAKPQ